MARQLELTKKDSTTKLTLLSLSLSIFHQAFLAETTIKLVYQNPTDEKLEGELVLPLQEGTFVSGYQVDVQGRMVPGVVVEKEKARATFEAEVRKERGGPAIAETVVGSVFRTRVYPFLPNATRILIITLSHDLSNGRSLATDPLALTVPFLVSQPIPEITIEIEAVVPPDESVPTVSSFNKAKNLASQLTFTKKTHDSNNSLKVWSTRGQFENTSFDQEFRLKFSIADLSLNSWATTVTQLDSDDELAFASAIPTTQIIRDFTPGGNSARPRGKSLAVFWDCSRSRKNEDKAKEISALQSILTALMPGEPLGVEIFPFNVTLGKSQKFQVSNSALISSVTSHISTSISYDSGTNYSCLNAFKANSSQYFAILIFTDGVSFVALNNRPIGPSQLTAPSRTFGSSDIPDMGLPVHLLSNSLEADTLALKKWAHQCGGGVYNLTTLRSFDSLAPAILGKIELSLLSVTTSSQDALLIVVPAEPLKLGPVLKVAGKLSLAKLATGDADSVVYPASVTLSYNLGLASSNTILHTIQVNLDISTARRKKIGLAPSGDPELSISGRFWAQQRMDRLQLFESVDESARQEILRLGRKYTLVSANTSLIVLDLLEQYLEHEITPPKSLPEIYKEYKQIMGERLKVTEDRVLEKITQSLNWWDRRRHWYGLQFQALGGKDTARPTHPSSELAQLAKKIETPLERQQLLHFTEFDEAEMNGRFKDYFNYSYYFLDESKEVVGVTTTDDSSGSKRFQMPSVDLEPQRPTKIIEAPYTLAPETIADSAVAPFSWDSVIVPPADISKTLDIQPKQTMDQWAETQGVKLSCNVDKLDPLEHTRPKRGKKHGKRRGRGRGQQEVSLQLQQPRQMRESINEAMDLASEEADAVEADGDLADRLAKLAGDLDVQHSYASQPSTMSSSSNPAASMFNTVAGAIGAIRGAMDLGKDIGGSIFPMGRRMKKSIGGQYSEAAPATIGFNAEQMRPRDHVSRMAKFDSQTRAFAAASIDPAKLQAAAKSMGDALATGSSMGGMLSKGLDLGAAREFAPPMEAEPSSSRGKEKEKPSTGKDRPSKARASSPKRKRASKKGEESFDDDKKMETKKMPQMELEDEILAPTVEESFPEVFAGNAAEIGGDYRAGSDGEADEDIAPAEPAPAPVSIRGRIASKDAKDSRKISLEDSRAPMSKSVAPSPPQQAAPLAATPSNSAFAGLPFPDAQPAPVMAASGQLAPAGFPSAPRGPEPKPALRRPFATAPAPKPALAPMAPPPQPGPPSTIGHSFAPPTSTPVDFAPVVPPSVTTRSSRISAPIPALKMGETMDVDDNIRGTFYESSGERMNAPVPSFSAPMGGTHIIRESEIFRAGGGGRGGEEESTKKIRRVSKELEQINQIMHSNIDQVLNRGEKLENLVDRSSDLALESRAFMRQALSLKRRMWWRNAKLIAIIVGLLAVVGLIFYFVPLAFIFTVITLVLAQIFLRKRLPTPSATVGDISSLLLSVDEVPPHIPSTSPSAVTFVDLRNADTATGETSVVPQRGVDLESLAARIHLVQEQMQIDDSEARLESALESIDDKAKNQRKLTKKANTSYYRLGFQYISGDEMNNATGVRSKFRVASFFKPKKESLSELERIVAQGIDNFDAYLGMAEDQMAQGQQNRAVQLLANLCEFKLDHPQPLRLVAMKLEELGLDEMAVDLYQRVLKLRPEEPQSRRDLALVLARTGRHLEAMNLLHEVIVGQWDARFNQIEIVALQDMAVIGAKLDQLELLNQLPQTANAVLSSPMDVDLRVVLTWDSDNIDCELGVIEPSGERCYPFRNTTANGGMMSKDMSGGYGPVEYLSRRCLPGDYRIFVKLATPSRSVYTGAVTAKLQVTTNAGRGDMERSETFVCRLFPNICARQPIHIATVSS